MSRQDEAAAPADPAAPANPAAATPGAFKTKNLVIIGLVTAAVWAMVIASGYLVAYIIAGVLTVLLAAAMIWAFRQIKRQQGLVSLLQGASHSPEARRDAIAKLAADKDAGSVVNVFARAQLLAAEDPAAALKTLETIDMKDVAAQMQDDVAVLKAQLLLHFGRPKEARPLVDKVNVDNPQRKEARTLMVSIVAEAWARTGKHDEAIALLDTVNAATEKNEQLKIQLLVGRIFARFAGGKRNLARDELKTLADIDVNHLARFVMPQFRVHPELQKLARDVAQKNPKMRRMAAAQPRRR